MMGIINLFKPPGMTSFDCVREARRLVGIKKIGHTGTLDPLACGVLPLCLGRGTKLVPFLMESKKVYRGELYLGLETTTLDLDGDIISTSHGDVEMDEIVEVFSSFVGRQMQLPPLFSAKKTEGRRYYQLAREGKEIERTPSEIVVYDLKMIYRKDRRILFETRVSKGTYVRSLVRDIGERLGCGACLSLLIRTEVGPFCIKTTKTFEEIEEAFQENEEDRVLLPGDSALVGVPAVHIKNRSLQKVKNGVQLKEGDVITLDNIPEGLVRLYLEDKFLAIYDYKGRTLRASKVFV